MKNEKRKKQTHVYKSERKMERKLLKDMKVSKMIHEEELKIVI